MNFTVHLVLAVLLTACFLFRFIKDRHIYQLPFVLWVPSTLLTYLPLIAENRTLRLVLGGFQLVMFVLVVFFMFRRNPKRAAAVRAAMKAELQDTPAPAGEASADADPADNQP